MDNVQFTDCNVVLKARPWPRDASRPIFMALALSSGPMTLAMASKVQALVLALKVAWKIFVITFTQKGNKN